ncbi:MAG: argininosuccinate lyase [Litoreibacter sp.]
MKYVISLSTVAMLAACGIDGEPSTPEPVAATKSGISITGRAEVGLRKKW